MGPKTDVIVKLSLVFFISLLSFSIGTFVGKKYSDNQHKLASMEGSEKTDVAEHGEGSSANREVASESHGDAAHAEDAGHGEAPAAHGEDKKETSEHSASANHEESKPGAKLTDEEIKKLAEEFVADDKAPSAHGAKTGHGEEHGKATEDSHAENNQHGQPANKHEAAAENKQTGKEKSVAKNEAHAPAAAQPLPVAAKMANKAEDERKPSSIPKNVSQYEVGKFTVQVGAFSTEEEAKSRSTELKGQGLSAFYFPAEVKGKTWYRVSIGMFATEKEARDYRAEVMAKAKLDSAMVQKIQQK